MHSRFEVAKLFDGQDSLHSPLNLNWPAGQLITHVLLGVFTVNRGDGHTFRQSWEIESVYGNATVQVALQFPSSLKSPG
jgi:hypothetical protein